MTTQRFASEPPLDQPYYGIPFLKAGQRMVQKAFVYTGRASPSEYWFGVLWFVAGYFAGLILLGLMSVLLTQVADSSTYGIISLIIGFLYLVFWVAVLAFSLATIALSVRRLHDAGDPGTYYLFSLIPFAGGIVLLVFLLKAPSPLGLRFDLPPGITRGYLFVPAGTNSSPGAAPGSGFTAPTALGYPAPDAGFVTTAAPGYAAPVSGFAAPTIPGYAAPSAPGKPASAPGFAPGAVPAVPAMPAAPVVVPPVPAAPALSVPPVPAAPVPPVPAAPVPPVPAVGPIQSIPGAVLSVPPVPSVAPAAVVVPANVAATLPSAADDDLDSTRLTARPTGSWRVLLADGRQIALGSSARLGRDPAADPADPSALLIPVDDPAKSISKTHVALSVASDGILITDVHSTNGSVVRTADGAQTVLTPDAPYRVSADAELRIGDYVMHLQRKGD
ncbi:DUF805 domain-containing protein [Microbacterium sp. 22242]|uniref:DUF805 domain-containing protein n=1 Tax=Microbacterium sp. 22242 TaxID=3453896 RepID=UPI003F84D0CB